MDQPLISIVLTTFNSEDTIADVLDAILNQDMPLLCIELIVVDGGSGDQTLEIVKNFFEKYGSLFYNVKLFVHDKNYGLSRARNDGIKASNGKYILILDDDVIISKTTLRKLVEFLEKAPPNVAAIIPLHINYTESVLDRWARMIKENRITRASAITSCALIRREVIYKVGLYDETLGLPFTMGEEIEYYARAKNRGYEAFILGFEKVLHIIDGKAWKETKYLLTKGVLPSRKPMSGKSLYKLMIKALTSLGNKSYIYAYKKYVKSLPLIDKLRWYTYSSTILFAILFIIILAVSSLFNEFKRFTQYFGLALLILCLTLYTNVLREYWNPKVLHISLTYSVVVLIWRILRSIMLILPNIER